MEQDISFQLDKGRTASGHLKVSKATQEKTGKENVFSSLKKGQLISGTVVSAKDTVTISFAGQEVTAPGDVLKDAEEGDVKFFEVTKVTGKQIELKVLPGTPADSPRMANPTFRLDKDQETLMDRKEKTARQSMKDKELKDTLSKMDAISARLTEEDYQALEEEGFSAEDLTVDGLFAALSRLKTTDSSGNQQVQDNPFTEEAIKNKLEEENLPATNENVRKIKTALELSDITVNINDKTIKYMISNGLEPTIENIYKAYFNGNTLKTGKAVSLSDEEWNELKSQAEEIVKSAGYEVNDENLADAKWLIENGLPLTAESFDSRKVLEEIKSGTVKKETLDKIIGGMKEGILPKDVSLKPDKDYEILLENIKTISEEAVNRAVNDGTEITLRKLIGIQAGLPSDEQADVTGMMKAAPGVKTDPAVVKTDSPVEVNVVTAVETKILPDTVTNADTAAETGPAAPEKADAAAAAETVSTAETKADSSSAAEIGSLNMDTTTVRAEENSNGDNDDNGDTGYQGRTYEEIRAKRQLEEIRLKMTADAAARLDKMGIHPDTEKLEKVVEALRDLEDRYYKGLLKEADVEADKDNVRLLKDTISSVGQLRYIPSAVLGSTLTQQDQQTITGLLKEGNLLKAEYSKAGEAYETLMTVPNPEYGDSIKKAFKNMGPILKELGLDDTELNQKAVRILGYNRTDITGEAVERVKAYDLEVTGLIRNLHPAVAVRIIREGINPLRVPIRELNDTIDRMKEEQGITSDEKFSTYLQKLEKTDSITPAERKAYIGIYRLLYNVDKSDGAALGAVLKSDREITLNSLLTAVRTIKKGSIDSVIDDEFGTLNNLEKKSESITEQTGAVFSSGEDTESQGGQSGDELQKKQSEYLGRIIKNMKDAASPEKLSRLQQEVSSQASRTEQSTSAAVPELSSRRGIWETLKDVPVEKLYDRLDNYSEADSQAGDYEGKVREIRELYKNSDAAVRFLDDYKIPNTAVNLMLANHILSNGDVPMKKLLKPQNENMVENSENGIKETDEFTDKLIDKDSINEEYEKLEESAKVAIENACSGETIDSSKLAQLKSIGMQMTFLKTLAGKEFYRIPIESNGVITNMNLTILHDSKASGKLSVTVWSKQLGNFRAELSLKDKTLKGFIGCDNRDGLELLRENSDEIEKAVKENGITIGRLDYAVQAGTTESYGNSYREPGAEQTSVKSENEKLLYRLAKAMVITVRSAELAGTGGNRIAS